MSIVNAFDLLGDDDTDPIELTGLHEEIIKKTNDEKKKAKEELAKAKALAEKKAAKHQNKNTANVEKSGKETQNGAADTHDNGRGYARNGQNNWENLSGRGYGNNRNFSGYSGGYNNAVEDGVNNYSNGSERQSYNGSYRGGYRNGEGSASYGRAPHRQFDRQNYNNGNVGGNYERASQRQVASQDGKGNGRIEELLEDGFVLPSRRHVTRQSSTATLSKKLSESSQDHGITKTAVDGVLTQEPSEISKTENNTLILENEVKKDELPASAANNEEKEKKEAELPASEANNKQKANVAEEEQKMTLAEYEKILEEKRKPLLALRTTAERKVQLDKEFQSMQQLSLKNQRDANLRGEKMKKLSGQITVPQVSVKGETKKDGEEAKRQELLKNVHNVLRRERYQRPRPQFREGGYGGQISSDTAQSNGSQGPQSLQGLGGQTSSDIAPSNGSQGYGDRPQSARGYGGQTSSNTVQSNGNQGNGNRPQSARGYGGQTSSNTVQSDGNQGNGDRPQSGRAQSNRNQGYGNHRQSEQGSKPQKEASAPSLGNSAEFPPLKIGKV